MDSKFKADLQKSSKENRARIRWRTAVEAAEHDWKDCLPEDLTQMAGELAVLLQSLKSDISESKMDELVQTELMDYSRTSQILPRPATSHRIAQAA